jgi:hypothetical protein
VLDLVLTRGELAIDTSAHFHLELPTDPAFLDADLSRDLGDAPGRAERRKSGEVVVIGFRPGQKPTNPRFPAPAHPDAFLDTERFGLIDRSVERSPCARRSDRPKQVRTDRLRCGGPECSPSWRSGDSPGRWV